MSYVYSVMVQFWKGSEAISIGLVDDYNSSNTHENWRIAIGRSDIGSLLIEILNADFVSADPSLIADNITALYTSTEMQNDFLYTEARNATNVLYRIKKFIDYFDSKCLPYNLHFFNFLWVNRFFVEDTSILEEAQTEFDKKALWDIENDCLVDDIDLIYQTIVGDSHADGSEVFLFAGEYRIWAIALASLRAIVKNGIAIKKCKNCGKYFIPSSRSDEIYCDNRSPQDISMSCKEYGTRRLWYERQKEDELATLSRKIASSKGMLAKRNPDIPQYAESYEYFKAQRLIWIKAVKNGAKTPEEYREWLLYMQGQKIIKEAQNAHNSRT